MKLYAELISWENEKAQLWASNMRPLVDLLSERTIQFLDKLSTPLRPGTHANSAFSFSLIIEYAEIANDKKLLNKIKEYSIKNFMGDINCPVNYEPSGTDFLSPCLAEASLMSSILSKKDFNDWFYKFILILNIPLYRCKNWGASRPNFLLFENFSKYYFISKIKINL